MRGGSAPRVSDLDYFPPFLLTFWLLSRLISAHVRFLSQSGSHLVVVLTSPFSHWQKSVLPKEVEHWSLTTLRDKLIKIGTKVARHGRYVTFQLDAVTIPKVLLAGILRRIDGLRPASLPP